MPRTILASPSASTLVSATQRRLQHAPLVQSRTQGACAAAAAAARQKVRVQARAQPPEERFAGVPRRPPHSSSTSDVDSSSFGSGSFGSGSLGTAAAVSAAVLLLPLVHPEAAAAAAAALPTEHIQNMYWMSIGMGSLGVVTTLLLTSRFLMSFFPELEKRAKQRPSKALMLRALTVADPVLDPVTKGLFRMTESGDPNYGAVFLLALSSGLLATLLGDGGPMVNVVPDLTLLQGLRYLVYFQHMLLLPMWVFVVFRFFLLI